MKIDVYPDGMRWRCGRCDFTCDDTGPDNCPHDGTPMTRTVLVAREVNRNAPICGGSKCSTKNGCGVGKPCPFIPR